MANSLNPFNFLKRHRGDIEQMLEDIDRVEETPATRYNRKVEINMSISPYGKLRPYQREFLDSLIGKPKPYVDLDRDTFEFPGQGGPVNLARPREQQFVRVQKVSQRPLQVVVISGAGQYAKAAAQAQAAMERELEMKWIDFCETPPVEQIKTVDDIVKQIAEMTLVPLEMMKPDTKSRPLTEPEKAEQKKRNRAPRKR
jgi:hypothetical protein